MKLTGKVALVTGAASGIGAAIATTLAAAGASVAINYRTSQAPAEALATEITAQNGNAKAFGGDVSSPDQAITLSNAVAKHFGKIDILINNAGLIEPALFAAITPESFHRQFTTNTLSVLLMMQAAIPHFPESGGRVINISSSLAIAPVESTAAYAAAKAAVNTLTQCFARELGPKNITVNAIAPGATETPMTAAIPSEIKQKISAQTPLGRWATPKDIADAALFLASDSARFITGRILTVDGGLIY
jgi:3-oxoacyl-[acyl-carrier protein] reductase